MSLNRLNGLLAYLSGPIDFDPTMGVEWREDMTNFLSPLNVKVLNPLKHIFYGISEINTAKRKKISELIESGNYEDLRKEYKDINHWDLRSVDLSSFLVVNYDTSIHMCGTIEEIVAANKQSKPVLMVCKNGKKKLPGWLYGRFPHEHMFETWDELKAYLWDINSHPEFMFSEADSKRFLFFDGEHMNGDISLKRILTGNNIPVPIQYEFGSMVSYISNSPVSPTI